MNCPTKKNKAACQAVVAIHVTTAENKSVIIVAAAGLHGDGVVRKLVDKPVLAVNPPAELPVLVLEPLRLPLSLQRAFRPMLFSKRLIFCRVFLSWVCQYR